MGASQIIAVETVPERIKTAKEMGADIVVDFRNQDPVEAIRRITNGRGVDVAIEALGLQETFEAALRVLRPGGVLLVTRCLFHGSSNSARCIRSGGLVIIRSVRRSVRGARNACAA